MNNYYTGVGSRETPPEILKIMTLIAKKLEIHGFVLRTGDASGADKAFRDGVSSLQNKEIYTARDAKEKDYYIAESIHPAWGNCSDFAKKLHTRNLYQVKGSDLDCPAEFLICWTKNGKDIGGTRTAIMYARQNNIPVFNLALKEDVSNLIEFIIKKYNFSLI